MTIKTGSKQQAVQGVKITDFNTGESVRTNTTNGVVTSRTYSGGGSSARARQLVEATKQAEAQRQEANRVAEANRQAELVKQAEALKQAQIEKARI